MTVMDDMIKTLQENPDLARLNPDLAQLNSNCAIIPEPVRKYRNTPTAFRGRVYDSIKEANYARQLELEQAAGEVICWMAQVVFDLQPGIKYIADFVVIRKNWEVEIVDVKPDDRSLRTPLYKTKKKMFKNCYGRDIKEV